MNWIASYRYANGKDRLWIDLCYKFPGNGHGDHGGNASGTKGQACQEGSISHQCLEENGQKDDGSKEIEENEENDDIPCAEGKVFKSPQIDDRILCKEFNQHEHD